jgi:hypothetical protein
MDKIFSLIYKFIKKYTTGAPFIIWAAGGLAVAIFVIIFRHRPEIQFDRLSYVIAISSIWFVASDMAKKKNLFNKHLHFVIDSFFYLATFFLFVYFTGGHKSSLLFVFFFGAISAPLFSTVLETFIFTIFLSAANISIHFLPGDAVDSYSIAASVLQAFFYFIIAGIIKYELAKVEKIEKEKRLMAEKSAEELKKKVVEKTGELIRKNKDLQSFNNATVDRELKMAELKKEINRIKK